ncbi:lipoprotein [Spiroplasma turonicum]|uniref:Lipoprotein n=1 Tax=Spiroplasma turonicum TaxID=216946 RepID=A0A0K1P5S0_9MOLU|nr:lipoprotein [Spiroplasma turonicum]AKU79676.1 hypothetical protein STURON_00430 [Spiroplasma turonicum]ALX70696.1 hypothetical protein STURO_v1c04280 [Spiroplasma turonicum]
MKKVLTLLTAFAISASASSTVIACGSKSKDEVINLDFTSKSKTVAAAKTVYDTFKGDNAPSENSNLVINFNLPGDINGSVKFSNKQYKDIFTSENNTEILNSLNKTVRGNVENKDDLKDVEQNMQKAFNNYFVTKAFMDDMKKSFENAGSNNLGTVNVKDAYSEKVNKKTEYDDLTSKVESWMSSTLSVEIPENTFISWLDLDYSSLAGWKISIKLMIDSNGNHIYDDADKDQPESNQIGLDVKQLKSNSTQAEVDAENKKESWMDKAKNSVALGIYKFKLFLQQLVLTNGKDWLEEVTINLLVGFGGQAISLIPALKALLKVPGAEFILNKLILIPLSSKLAKPLVNMIVDWANNNAKA